MKPFRPMLAANHKDIPGNHRFPVLATPKFDGIRCITLDGVPKERHHQCIPVCRSLKDVPNSYVYDQIATHCPPGLDGEIMTYDHPDMFEAQRMRDFYEIQSDVMCRTGNPLFKYHVFDFGIFRDEANKGWGDGRFTYDLRIAELQKINLPSFVSVTLPTRCESMDELEQYEAKCVTEGYEGICYRIPASPYKYGRSTVHERYLVKMKRMQTSDAEVIGMEEEMGNNNPVSYNDLGYAERSSHKDNMRGKNRLGALIVRNGDGVEFKIGTGFTADQRENIWLAQAMIIGTTVTYKHQPHGQKDAPRIPVFVGFRMREDQS